jgi:hypothetical protein
MISIIAVVKELTLCSIQYDKFWLTLPVERQV